MWTPMEKGVPCLSLGVSRGGRMEGTLKSEFRFYFENFILTGWQDGEKGYKCWWHKTTIKRRWSEGYIYQITATCPRRSDSLQILPNCQRVGSTVREPVWVQNQCVGS